MDLAVFKFVNLLELTLFVKLSNNAVDLAIATTQMSVTPGFMVLLVAIFLRKKISLLAFIGMAIAIGGVALLMQPNWLPTG